MDYATVIQQQIDALPVSGSVPNGAEGEFGGIVGLPSGQLYLTKPLRVPSCVTLQGKGVAATTLIYEGPDKATILLTDRNSGNGPFDIRLTDFAIRTKSAGGISLDRGLRGEPESLQFERIVFNTGGIGIDLNGLTSGHVSYQSQFRNLSFISPGAVCIRGAMRQATLDQVGVSGMWRGGPVPRALFDFDGDASTGIIDSLWIEGELPESCSFLKLSGGGEGFEGNWTLRGTWNEPHWNSGTAQIILNACNVFVDRLQAKTGAPILLKGGTVLYANYLRATTDAGLPVDVQVAFKADKTSRAYANGKIAVGREVVVN